MLAKKTPPLGVVLVNLGTPDAPTAPAVRRFLKQFLSDTRVIEIPPILWQIILNLFILLIYSFLSYQLFCCLYTV